MIEKTGLKGILMVAVIVCVCGLSMAQTISINPALGTVNVNDALTVEIVVDTGGETITAVQAYIDFNSNIEIVGGAGGITPDATWDLGGRKVINGSRIELGLGSSTGGCSGSSCIIATFDIKGLTEGTGTLTFVQADTVALTSLNIDILTAFTDGSYSVVIPPTITADPQDQNICDGDQATFSISATGTAPNYQWKKDGNPLTDDGRITGSQTDSLSIDPAGSGDIGAYTCSVSNAGGSETSSAGNLTIKDPTAIVTHPVSVHECENSEVTFSVVASGAGTLTYQWQKDRIDIKDATSIQLILSSISSSDIANYRCKVIGDCGEAISNEASLTLKDNTVIVSHPDAQNECPENDVYFTVSATGENLQYQWQKNGVDIQDNPKYQGTDSATLTVKNVEASDAGAYRCVVTGDCGTENSNTVALTLKAATTITTHPVSQNKSQGDNATFTVSATGEGTLTYQWQKDGTDLSNGGKFSGCQTNALTISSVTSSEAGSYRCVVDGGCGSETSNPANLTVDVIPGDLNKDGCVDLVDLNLLSNDWDNAAGNWGKDAIYLLNDMANHWEEGCN
jgi:immunoglobulin I-set domain protein